MKGVGIWFGVFCLAIAAGAGLGYAREHNRSEAMYECVDRAAQSHVSGDDRATTAWILEAAHASETGNCRDNFDPRLADASAISTD